MEKILNNGLILPQSGYEITSKEEMSYEDGGNLNLYISCSLGGVISGVVCGALTGFITGYLTAKLGKLGSSGGWIGMLVGAVVGGTLGYVISQAVNKLICGSCYYFKILLVSIWFFGINYDHEIDIGEKLGSIVSGGGGGGFGGFLGGLSAAAATAKGLAYGAIA